MAVAGTSTCVPWSLNMLCSPTRAIQAAGSSVRKDAHTDLRERGKPPIRILPCEVQSIRQKIIYLEKNIRIF